jgi:hypothetical protein
MKQALTIPRADLIQIAAEAMKHSGITDEQHLEMCETAHTIDQVQLGTWLTKDCGCLVGATYRTKFPRGDLTDGKKIEEVLGESILLVGLRFDRLLKSKTQASGSREVVQVID